MIVEAALGARLRASAVSRAHVHGVDGRFASSKRTTNEQSPQSFGVYLPLREKGRRSR